jgi:hypothetical protein
MTGDTPLRFSCPAVEPCIRPPTAHAVMKMMA